MGSAGIAALIAHIGFWVLLAYGWFWEELTAVGVTVFVALWICGFFGLPYLPNGAAFVSSYIAALDIALVFIVFKGDLPLT